MGRVEHGVPLFRNDERWRDQNQGLGALQPGITGLLIPCAAVRAGHIRIGWNLVGLDPKYFATAMTPLCCDAARPMHWGCAA